MPKRHTVPLHHKHHRYHRAHKDPANNSAWVRFLDTIIYPVGLIGPIAFIPQVIEVWSLQSSQGLSSITWVTLTVVSFIWLLYGFTHKANAIILTRCCGLCLNGAMAVATLIF